MIKLSWVVIHSQRLHWDGKREMVCSPMLWYQLIQIPGLPPSMLNAIGRTEPFKIGLVTWRLQTTAEAYGREHLPRRSMVPAIRRKRDD